jgi:trimethylamine:corrinoid methyltransferase-like protein
MKFVLATALLFVGLSANASLKLQAQANGYENGTHTRPQVGLAFYQPFMRNRVALNTWAGTGIEPFMTKEAVRWSSAKASLDYYIKDLTVGLGMQVKDIQGADNSRSYGFVKLEYKLF